MKVFFSLFIVSLLVTAMFPTNVFAAKKFQDIQDHPYKWAIETLQAYKVVTGYEGNMFDPERQVTRAEALKMIYISMEIPLSTESILDLEDVQKDDWFFPYVADAISKKIVSGFSDKTFRPNEVVKRGEFLKMFVLAKNITLVRTVSKEDIPFTDISKHKWHARYVVTLEQKDMLPDGLGATFEPENGATRAFLVEILYRGVFRGQNRPLPPKTPEEIKEERIDFLNEDIKSKRVQKGIATFYFGIPVKSDTTEDHFTAAHPSLPFGTKVKVTNTKNEQSVVVTINDCGPFSANRERVIDLSNEAFEKIGSLGAGILPISLEVIDTVVEKPIRDHCYDITGD